jgi:hypothetical protein
VFESLGGFPRALIFDSTCWLDKEGSGDGETLFE